MARRLLDPQYILMAFGASQLPATVKPSFSGVANRRIIATQILVYIGLQKSFVGFIDVWMEDQIIQFPERMPTTNPPCGT